MKKTFLLLLASLMTLFLIACGGESPQDEPEQADRVEQAAEEIDAEPEEEPEYEDLSAPFETFRAGAEVDVKNRTNHFEISVTCADFSADTEPDGWADICASLTAMLLDSQAASDAAYEAKTVSFQLKDSAGNILCSGYNGKIQYNAFQVPEQTSSANDSRITLAEYNQIVIGMTYSECVEIIGGDGTIDIEIGGAGEITGSIRNYTWQGTTDYGSATLSFDDYVLYSKVQFGLE